MQEEKLLFSNCTIVNEELFFVETQYGLPAKMNPDNGDVSYCGVMENFILKVGDSLHDIRAIGNRIYALETSGEHVMSFDLENLRCQYILLRCSYRKWGNFAGFEYYDSHIYIFPRYENKVCIMNMNTNEITEVADYFDGIEELQCSCRVGDEVWLIPNTANVIGCYDLSNGRMKVYDLKKKIENGIHAVFMKGNIYILNSFGIIYIWNIHDMQLSEMTILETEHLNEKSMCRMVFAGNKLIILPSLAEDIKMLDLLTGKAEVYHDYPEDFFYYDIKGWSKYYGFCEDDNYYYFAMRKENYLLKICKQDGRLLWIKPHIPSQRDRKKIHDPLKERNFKRLFEAGERFFLEAEADMENFLAKVPQREYVMEETNIGEGIFKRIKDMG